MFFIFAGVLDILVPARIANRYSGAFKSVIKKLVAKPSGGSGTIGSNLKFGSGSGNLTKPGTLIRTSNLGGSGALNRVNPLKKENSNCERQEQLVKYLRRERIIHQWQTERVCAGANLLYLVQIISRINGARVRQIPEMEAESAADCEYPTRTRQNTTTFP